MIKKFLTVVFVLGAFAMNSFAGKPEVKEDKKAETKKEKKADAKKAAAVSEVTLTGKIVKKVIKKKDGKSMNLYYLVSGKEEIKVANQVKGKKGFKDAAAVDLATFVDKSVTVVAYAVKTSTGKTNIKCIKSIK